MNGSDTTNFKLTESVRVVRLPEGGRAEMTVTAYLVLRIPKFFHIRQGLS